MLGIALCLTVTAASAQRADRGAVGAPTVAGPAAMRAESIVLEPGDLVRVTVWRKPELSGDFLVAADSSLKHPLYQSIKVAGVALPVARDRVLEYLRRLEAAPQISLEPLFRVTVGGEARQPSLLSLSPETSIAQAVALAGGPTERGRLDRIQLVRGGRAYMIDLTTPDASLIAMAIRSGDQISIGRRRDVLRDIVVPLASVTGALAAIASLFLIRAS